MKDFKLDHNKLKPFLESINNNKFHSKEQKPSLDIDNLYTKGSSENTSEIQELRNTMEDMQKKLSLLLSTQKFNESTKIKHIDQTLKYLKERVDLLIKHKNVKGEISSIEIKQLRVNILRDKIIYLENKLNSILEEREKRFETDKDFSNIRKERLAEITDSIVSLENKLKFIVEQSKPSEDVVHKIKSKIGELKKRSEKLLMQRLKQKGDVEFKVIKQISTMLEKKKQELHNLETELMLEKGIVEPNEKPVQISKPIITSSKIPKPVFKRKIKPEQRPSIKVKPKIHEYDFELPNITSNQHEFDLDLPSPIPLGEYHEESVVLPKRISEPIKKKKGFFYKVTHLLNKD